MSLPKFSIAALIGPIIPSSALILHVLYQHKFRQSDPLPDPEWPEDFDEEKKSQIIDKRKELIDDLKTAITGKDIWKILEQRMTPDVVWEDPIQRMEGQFELFNLANLARYYKSFTFEHYNEIHSAHEILLDWSCIITMKSETTLKIPMRTHVMLEPPDPNDGSEMIFKVVEDWGGNPQLSEMTCKPAVYGKVHQLLRRFHGKVLHNLVESGIL